jgi:peptidoglycan/LPS O-acetylase OafA/YrhL
VVSIFFVLSGFFRSLSYWKTWGTDLEAPRFFPSLRERFWRIAPVYYISLILTFLLFWYWHGIDRLDIIRLFSGFTFLSWASPMTFFPVDENGPLWFIAYDMVGWIMVSLLMILVMKFQKISQMAGVFLGTSLALLGAHFLWISLPWGQVP